MNIQVYITFIADELPVRMQCHMLHSILSIYPSLLLC